MPEAWSRRFFALGACLFVIAFILVIISLVVGSVLWVNIFLFVGVVGGGFLVLLGIVEKGT